MSVSTVLNSSSRSNRSHTESGSAAQCCMEPAPALALFAATLCLRWRVGAGHTEKASKSEAGGLNPLPLLLFRLGIVLVVDLQGLLVYNYEQQGMSRGFPQKNLSEHIIRESSV